MFLAVLTTEEQWDLGLLGINVFVLLTGVLVARRLATAENGSFRFWWPAYAGLLLGAFAVFDYFARYYVK